MTKRKTVMRLIGEKKPALASAPLWIFVCCDAARPLRMFEILKIDCSLGEVTRLIHSVVDASLAAENVVIAAKALGLSSVFTIYHWKALGEISELLQLPGNVLPLLLLCIGYPAEKPPCRPRWRTEIVLHKERYRLPSKGSMMKNYDQSNESLVNMNYFDKGVTSLAQHWQKKFMTKEMIRREKNLRTELQKLGFLPKVL